MRNQIMTDTKMVELATMQLRPMSAAELPALLRLERQSYPTPWPASFFRRLLRRRASCWVFEENGVIVGYGVMLCVREWAHIMNLCVSARFRRRGLGRRMLIHLMRVAHHRGAKRAWLEVHPTNRGAIALYRSLGFSIRSRRKDYYRYSAQRQRDALVMWRPLRR